MGFLGWLVGQSTLHPNAAFAPPKKGGKKGPYLVPLSPPPFTFYISPSSSYFFPSCLFFPSTLKNRWDRIRFLSLPVPYPANNPPTSPLFPPISPKTSYCHNHGVRVLTIARRACAGLRASGSGLWGAPEKVRVREGETH